MRMKPHIDTLNVKSVFATGQNPTRLALLELGETNGAFDRILVRRVGESENGEIFQDGGIEATRSRRRIGGGEEKHCTANVVTPRTAETPEIAKRVDGEIYEE